MNHSRRRGTYWPTTWIATNIHCHLIERTASGFPVRSQTNAWVLALSPAQTEANHRREM